MDGLNTQQSLSVTLQMDDSMMAGLRAAEGTISVARSIVIDSPDMAQLANTELRDVISRKKAVAEWKQKFVLPAKEIIKNAEALFGMAEQRLKESEEHLRGLLTDWAEKEAARVAAERRRLEEQARQERAAAEARAAAERAKAEQAASDKRRESEAAEEARRKADEEGDKRAAQAAAAQAARLREEAAARVETGEAKAQEKELTASAAVAVVAPTLYKPAGFSVRDNWGAEFVKDEERALQAIVEAISKGRVELYGYLKVDMSAASKTAKALKERLNIPGIKAVNNKTSVSRGK
jgi:membrane protein involved in colicin uptake